jgi:TusA-related sulfurtransferase
MDIEIDARGLEPPQPMISILEALQNLPEGETLRAYTDRKPVHLYTHLLERGFLAETNEQIGGGFVTLIKRKQ